MLFRSDVHWNSSVEENQTGRAGSGGLDQSPPNVNRKRLALDGCECQITRARGVCWQTHPTSAKTAPDGPATHAQISLLGAHLAGKTALVGLSAPFCA